MHTPNETRPHKSQDQAAKEEVPENPYHDDRMYVLEIGESTQFKFPYDFDKGETRWSVITYGNWPYYPITRTDDFDTYKEAVTYLKGVAPLTPRVSLDGKCPKPAPSWDEFQDWLREQGLPSMPY
jgi:hypothetical protein